MKKRYKLLKSNGSIHILRWASRGVLFGPQWEAIATFDNRDNNIERCKQIVQIMNECDKHTNHTDNNNDTT